jgi:hypothetical protein
MNYCTLQEAWGVKKINENISNVESMTNVESIKNIKNVIDINCNDIITHIQHCKSCYNKIKLLYNNNNNNNNNLSLKICNLIEENKDIILLILITIFIILFYNLINNITKN